MKPVKAFRLHPEPRFEPPWWWYTAWVVVGLAVLGLALISQ